MRVWQDDAGTLGEGGGGVGVADVTTGDLALVRHAGMSGRWGAGGSRRGSQRLEGRRSLRFRR